MLPGLIDSHAHPADASLTEFDHPIPDMRSIGDVLQHVRERAKVVPAGKWIEIHQVFITRLAEQRYPTRAELDAAGRKTPWHLSLARTPHSIGGPGPLWNRQELRDDRHRRNRPRSGQRRADGRNAWLQPLSQNRIVIPATHRGATARAAVRTVCGLQLGRADYGERSCRLGSSEGRYRVLATSGRLTVRMAILRLIKTDGRLETIQDNIRQVAADPLVHGDARIWIVASKRFWTAEC